MRRDVVETLLNDAGTAGEACKTALQLGAALTVWDKRGPAFVMWSIWRFRHSLMQDNDVSTVGYETGLKLLADYGHRPIRLGVVRLNVPRCGFLLFFVADEARLVACVGHGDLEDLWSPDDTYGKGGPPMEG
ncbi:hypothetical protein GCM10010170_002950 [Dactylosporangium salmoneum]|uniref:Uncharacterized protein n=1 Tax=Dactylosporangium salmoneum TaxID=53361 RepID=A0ABN3FCN4_9ACTN